MTEARRSPALLSAMYQDVILQHYRAPHGRGLPTACTGEAERKNPLCGDQLRVGVVVRGDTITDVGFEGRGCSIATASASMMTDAVSGATVAEAHVLIEQVEGVLRGEALRALGEQPDLQALAGVAAYPQRVGCARMPWQALGEALGEALHVSSERMNG
jgi:nitrogen fixation NifU-like protein